MVCAGLVRMYGEEEESGRLLDEQPRNRRFRCSGTVLAASAICAIMLLLCVIIAIATEEEVKVGRGVCFARCHYTASPHWQNMGLSSPSSSSNSADGIPEGA